MLIFSAYIYKELQLDMRAAFEKLQTVNVINDVINSNSMVLEEKMISSN